MAPWDYWPSPPATAACRDATTSSGGMGHIRSTRLHEVRRRRSDYEIQINNRYPDPPSSGRHLGFVDDPKEIQFKERLEPPWTISSRNDKIRVMLNGKLAAEQSGDRSGPRRPDRFARPRSVFNHMFGTEGWEIGKE